MKYSTYKKYYLADRILNKKFRAHDCLSIMFNIGADIELYKRMIAFSTPNYNFMLNEPTIPLFYARLL